MQGRRLRRAMKIVGLLAVVGVAASGCSWHEVYSFGWPRGVTPQAHEMRLFWTWAGVAALIIGVIVWGLMVWTVIFHRKKGKSVPRQFQYNHSLEVVYTVIPILIVIGIFYGTTRVQGDVLTPHKPDVPVNVVAFQWNWEFDYPNTEVHKSNGKPLPGADGKPQMVSTVGTSDSIPILVVPAHETIGYTLSSKDVVHSFFVPQFHFKRDVFPYPGRNDQKNYFSNSIDTPGAFVGRCAELCGTYHSMMNFEVRALPPKQYKRYISLRQRVDPKTREPYTADDALAKMHCGKLCTPHAITTEPFNTAKPKNPTANATAGASGQQHGAVTTG
jgi:cytochrome c oxidase subunit 2